MRVFDPKRKKYNKTINHLKVCEFCNEQNKQEQECKSLAGKHWMVWAAKYPYLDGNVMIIPRRHVTQMSDIKNDEWEELQKIILATQKKLTKIFKTKAFNIGINIGKEAGASIEHLHIQILPRKIQNHTAMNLFADLYLVSLSPKELKKMIDKT